MNINLNHVSSELKLTFFVMLFILFLEVFIRILGGNLSGDIKHINSIPEISKGLSKINFPSILFLGNSLTNNAININSIKKAFKKTGNNSIYLGKATPDGTSLYDWYFLYKNYFSEKKNYPDIIVCGFAWSQLTDQSSINTSRLAGSFGNMNDIPELYNFGVRDVGDIMDFTIADISQVYAKREVISKRILDFIIPSYRFYTRKLNDLRLRSEKQKQNSVPKYTFGLLKSFLQMLQRDNVKIIFIAMPVVTDYKMVSNFGQFKHYDSVLFFDYRHLDIITNDLYLDQIHLNNKGSQLFSQKLVQDIVNHKFVIN